MGSVVYALWWLIHRPTNFAYDMVVFCGLLSLDCQTIFRWWVWWKAHR